MNLNRSVVIGGIARAGEISQTYAIIILKRRSAPWIPVYSKTFSCSAQ